MLEILKKVLHDSVTSETGDYDPARLIGYMAVILTYVTWLVMTVYFALKTNQWDPEKFASSSLTLSGMLVAAAAGVWLKRDTERKP